MSSFHRATTATDIGIAESNQDTLIWFLWYVLGLASDSKLHGNSEVVAEYLDAEWVGVRHKRMSTHD